MMLKTASLYDANNAAFINTLDTLKKDLDELMGRTGSLRLELIEDNIFLNQEKMKTDLYSYNAFIFIQEDLKIKKLGGLTIDTPPNTDELKVFMNLLARFRPSELDDYQTFNSQLALKKIENIHAIEPRRKQLATSVDEKTVSTNKASALRDYVRAVQSIKDSISNIQGKQGFDLRKTKRIVYNLVNHSFDEGYAFVSLSTIKNYDLSTYHHCVNVCILCISFGQNLGLNKRQLADLGVGALYHDIGKVNIPKDILNKSGKFTNDEWRIMKQHPVMAIHHLLPLRGATDMDIKKAVPAFEHHREYDLSGYPPQTIRKPLNFYSKVVSIADAYDAMTSGRIYQKGLLPSEALQIILKGAGKKFDPVLVKAFVNTMGVYPVGSVVQLNNGDIGIVSEISRSLNKSERPKIILIMNKSNVPYQVKTIDLIEPQYQKLSIAKAVSAEDYKINVAHYLLGNQ
jgi:HD-GYP domain-containing protein (c-di-GMP phosphodiesterase class II)